MSTHLIVFKSINAVAVAVAGDYNGEVLNFKFINRLRKQIFKSNTFAFIYSACIKRTGSADSRKIYCTVSFYRGYDFF